ncbi:outer membrane protein [Phyllobacterium sp. OV277]|uniref:outer membrane protein n=1 Tax=Phyllobacterium sp. OV277 TaxID=1882772 RepID=UPI00089015B5|nr:outer membrane protein [Phyllobacterium sp. OV277]SDP49125.1 Opacity protein [Phyllobacterium sp. OV277]
MRLNITVLSAASLFSFFGGPVLAADLGQAYPPEVPVYAPLEQASGWYLRGDVAYNFKSDVKAKVDFVGGSSPSDYEMKRGFSPFIGIGYQFNDYLRGDVTVGYSQRDTTYFETTADLWEAMANAYVDLGKYYGITPYVGGGVGFANVNYDFQGPVYPGLKSGDTNRFEWALMAGVAIDVTPRLKLDLGYRYANINGADLYKNGDVTVSDDGIKTHQIRAGVRFNTW